MQRLKIAESISPTGSSPFGESINPYTGELSFHHTDVEMQGQGPALVIGRRTQSSQDAAYTSLTETGGWDLTIPRIQMLLVAPPLSGITYDDPVGMWWRTTLSGQLYDRCTQLASTALFPKSFGMTLIDERGQSHEILARDASNTLQPSTTLTGASGAPGVTTDHWQIACLPNTSNGEAGEAFLAIAPDGTKYWFNYLVGSDAEGDAAELPTFDSYNGGPQYANTTDYTFLVNESGHVADSWYTTKVDGEKLSGPAQGITKIMGVMYVTRIEDRFGNALTYSYTGDRATAITASDGRSAQLIWNTGSGRLTAVKTQPGTASERTWTYQYLDPPNTQVSHLSQVVRPDGSSWELGSAPVVGNGYLPLSCNTYSIPGLANSNVPATYSVAVKNPSGATGTFALGGVYHQRSNVAYECKSNGEVRESPIFITTSVLSETISGPGLTSATWNFQYSPTKIEYCANNVNCTGGSQNSPKWIDATDPGGNLTRRYYNNTKGWAEGKPVKAETYQGASTLLRRATMTYADPSAGPWPATIGASLQKHTVYNTFDMLKSETIAPAKNTETVQQGSTFTWQADTFDAYARPLSVGKWSGGMAANYSKTDVTQYLDNLGKWVLGQVEKVTCVAPTSAPPAGCGASGTVISETTYDPTYGLPLTNKSFGKLQQTLTYDTTSTVTSGQLGTVKTVKDGNNNITTLSSWKRGIPQTIKYPVTIESPTGATQSAVVHDAGWITSVTDENGYKTCYGYDAMGRMSQITYPSETTLGVCDTSAWNATVMSFVPTTLQFDIPAGHWAQVITQGAYRKITHFDAMWRPIFVQEEGEPGTVRYSSQAYDHEGRTTFSSYPVASASSISNLTQGTWTDYDALGRVTSVSQDSELGLLTTTTNYMTPNGSDGYYTAVTNPRGQVTRTWFQAFDQPNYDVPRRIQHADGSYTDVNRDVFGKPTTITRRNSDSTVSLTRSYAYNGNQELCRSVEPETGATLTGYDAAGNLKWSATGLPAATACEASGTSAPVAARRVDRTFDARNRVKTLSFPDTKGDQTWTYAQDGLVAQIGTTNPNVTNPIVNTYNYNKRRLLTSETVNIAGGPFTQSYTYNANGHLLTQTYANTTAVSYAPNALGQPTQVGTYATGVSYYPNGAIKQFTYGNGIVHTMTQNARQLPSRSTDCTLAGTCATANQRLDLGYTFDKHANVSAITDYTTGARQTRAMTYDNLDRLTQTTSAMFGTASYGYDVLDNLTRVTVGASAQQPARDHYYCYDATSRQLTFIRTSSCSGAAVTTLGYDVQGNVDYKNNADYVFDYGNRLRSAPGEWYAYDGHGRRVLSCTPAACDYQQYASNGQLSFHRDNRKGLDYVNLYLGGSLVAIREQPTAGGGAVAKYQHTDALGTPIATTDSAGAFIEKSEYEPYGKLVNRPLTDGPGFTGHVQDAATGLTYMQQRYYDSGVGRMLSVDPVTAYSSGDMQHFSVYTYAYNNPYRFTDPDGRAPDADYVSRAKAKQSFYDLKNGFEGVVDRNFDEGGRASYEIHVYKDGNEVGTFKEGKFVTKHGKDASAPKGFGERNMGKLKGLDNHMQVATGRIRVSPQRTERLKFNAKSMKAVGRFLGVAGVALTTYQVLNGDMAASEAFGVTQMGCGSRDPCGGYVPNVDDGK